MCSIYIENIEKKSFFDIFDIFKNITIISNPGMNCLRHIVTVLICTLENVLVFYLLMYQIIVVAQVPGAPIE